jgi:hypothetical protein
LKGIVDTGDAAGTDDVFEDAIRFKENMLAIGYLYFRAADRIDKG